MSVILSTKTPMQIIDTDRYLGLAIASNWEVKGQTMQPGELGHTDGQTDGWTLPSAIISGGLLKPNGQ